MATLRISSISFEHHPTGFGVGHARPRLSWRFSPGDEGDAPNWEQESFEIQLAWDHGKTTRTYHVTSSESTLVAWPDDRSLHSREAVQVRVRSHGRATNVRNVTDTKDTKDTTWTKSTEWSDVATVEAALLDQTDWSAKLTASSLLTKEYTTLPPLRFRKAFSLPAGFGRIAQARLYVTAHGVYEATINGQRVGREEMAPGWTSYGHRLLYQTFSVTDLVAAGSDAVNVMGVEVGEGWFAGPMGMNGRRYRYGDRLAILAQLEVVSDAGQVFRLVSDSSWKSCLSATTRSEIYNGEDYSTEAEQPGWNSNNSFPSPPFDDGAWAATEELPWPSSALLSCDIPPVRETEQVRPTRVFRSPSGQTLIDFGQNLVGKLRVRLPPLPAHLSSAGPGDRTVSFRHAEVLESGELGTRPLRGATQTDAVVLSDQSAGSWWTPKFTFHGFRYVQVNNWPAHDGLPRPEDLVACVLHSDLRRTGWFACSEPLLNQLHHNVLWSMKGNFFSLPTDCPQRDERQGWTGDIQVFCPSASFLYDTHGFLRNWLQDLAAEQLEDRRHGVPGLVVPDVYDHPNPPGPQCAWHDVAVLTPWDLYTSSGDRALLRTQYPSMQAWVDHGIPRGPNGLWDQNVWQYGDWLDPSAPPAEPGLASTDGLLVADAYLVRVLETMARVSSLLGETADAARYRQQAAEARRAFAHEYITPAGLLVADTQTAHAMALVFGLLDSPDRIRKSASRLSHLIHVARYRIATGFVGTPLIAHALSGAGHHQLAYRMLLEKSCPSWLYPITMGATTVWERWDSMLPDGSINPGEMTSFNHYALGSVANWLHSNVGGISPQTPGWRTICVRPVPGGTLTSASVQYDGPYGRIECAWTVRQAASQAGSVFDLDVVVPPNSKAVVTLPCDWKKPGETEPEKSTTVGSGKHHFTCLYTPDTWPPVPELARSTFRLEV